jgi:uncharacterized protein (DUF885 family)
MKSSHPLLFLTLLLCAFTATAQTPNINTLADTYIRRMFEASPEAGTFYGIANANNAALSDNSAGGIKKWQIFEDSLYKVLKTINLKVLSKADQATYSILYEQLEGDVDCQVCKTELWSVDQTGGWQLGLGELAAMQPVGDDIKRKATLERWGRIGHYIQNEIDKLQLGIQSGYLAPKVNVNHVVQQVNGMLTDTVEKSVFYTPALTDTNKAFGAALKNIIRTQINPSLRQYRDFLQNQYLGKAREPISISVMPNGKICYQALLRSYTTLKISPADLYDEGVQAVKDREAKTIEIGKKIYGTADLGEILKRVRADTSNNFSSAAELTAYSKAAVARVKAKLPGYFNILPKADVTITPIPAYAQRSSSPHYESATDDGTRPGTYFINLYRPNKQNKGTAEVTAFHETYPGHHLQISISRELVKSHPITKYIGNSGYAEGWARYTETLADEMRLYSSDLNRLQLYSQPPTGMVVDPGIHLKGWTREQAIKYTLEHVPTMSQNDAESYVDRIAIIPGQMTTYGAGELQFKTLRKLAEKSLGPKFNVKEFHDHCLEMGTIPLNMLSDNITQWIKSKQ